ncbi:MAG: hypothetical protein A2Y33_00155 [Spirochaetes bacterium GWF1_51_8]|nr:MAG: hypothetical protein A2Y33_00155 [Spirochaetes bacterium GWF1_51_8]
MKPVQLTKLDSIALESGHPVTDFSLLSGHNTLAVSTDDAHEIVYRIDGERYSISKESEQCLFQSPGYTRYGLVFAKGMDMFILLDGAVSGPYDMINGPFFAPNDACTAFIFRKDHQCYISVEKQVFGGYDEIYAPRFSPDGTRFGFHFENGDDKFVCIDGKVFGPYSFVYTPRFSRDSSAFCYGFDKDQTSGVCVNGEEYTGFEKPGECLLNSSGDIFAFTFRRGNGIYVNISSLTELGPYKNAWLYNRPDGDLTLIHEEDGHIELEKISLGK